jgi:hypothetical protein
MRQLPTSNKTSSNLNLLLSPFVCYPRAFPLHWLTDFGAIGIQWIAVPFVITYCWQNGTPPPVPSIAHAHASACTPLPGSWGLTKVEISRAPVYQVSANLGAVVLWAFTCPLDTVDSSTVLNRENHVHMSFAVRLPTLDITAVTVDDARTKGWRRQSS